MLSTPTRLLLVILSCFLFLAACDSMPTRSQSDAVLTAERAWARGDFAEAAQAFLDAAASQRSQRDVLHLRAAEAWREEGELERAAAVLEGISTRRFDQDTIQRLGLLQAEIALSRKAPQQALEILEGLASTISPRYRSRLLELRARAAEADDNIFFAASARAELSELLQGAERRENRRQTLSLLERLDDDALAFGAASLPIGHALYPQAARILLARGLPLPRPLPQDDAVSGDYASTAADGYRPFPRLALLLPLDGALMDAATAVRDGFITSYYGETRTRPEVRIYDTGSSPESAVAAWGTAIREGAQAIVGPLGRDAVAAIFEADREGQVPMLALNRGGTTPPPPGSLSFALTPEDEGTAIANRIVEHGGSRVLVIETGDEYGQRAAAAMSLRLDQRGARVVSSTRLPSDSPNYASAIQSGLNQSGLRKVAADGDTRIEQNRVQVDADAIFYAGRADQARLLMPQLRMAGVYDLPVYASSQITAGTGNTRLDRELDGIEFTDLPWLLRDQLPNMPTRAAVADLDSAHGNSARLFAFGMDAFLLIGHFDQFRRDPQAVLSGATGQLRFDGFGQILRTPDWAKFQGGRIVPARERGLIGDEIQFRQP